MITKFFCKNLLSDYIDGYLPSSREKEVKEQIHADAESGREFAELKATLELLKKVESPALSNELSMQIVEAAQGKRVKGVKPRLTQVMVLVVVPVAFIFALAMAFPQLFPWVPKVRQPASSVQFTRYYPLFQGAGDILEEHGTFLQMRDSFMGSLWEEGGLSPEEFEKTFQPTPIQDEEK